MALHSLPAEIILSRSRSTLGYLHLDWNPQPGACLEVDGQTYLVLERRHHYQLRSGRYQLHTIALYVQTCDAPTEGSLLDGRWVIGDHTCLYNARSELLRCAVNPSGPCDRCAHYQAVGSGE
ncbi:MAG: hypothetical protein KME42_13280 [Tildeniella nuda ZEHNDER 1965/U140]|nr:hypothetical protein [Tildeniella nuda ZEHNDER 1965/U140]